MLSLFACFCVGSILCGHASGYAANDYALTFTNSHANIWGMRSLSQFTVCFWMKSSDTSKKGTPFSYNTPGRDNDLLIYNYKDFHLFIGGTYRRVHQSANDGKWHHICASWRNSDGAFQFYKDGALGMHSTGLKTGYIIRGGGSLVLGQEQDSPGGGFESIQAFRGSLTNVNVWSVVLSPGTIRVLARSCLAGAGNVYKWSDFRDGIKGNTALVIPSPCRPPSSQG